LEARIKRENSNITTRRTNTKPRKDSGTNLKHVILQPPLQFWHSEQKQKAEEELSAVPECLINIESWFSSAMGAEQDKTRVVPSASKDIGDLPFPMTRVSCHGMQIGTETRALTHFDFDLPDDV
jgi:hypothetical protein